MLTRFLPPCAWFADISPPLQLLSRETLGSAYYFIIHTTHFRSFSTGTNVPSNGDLAPASLAAVYLRSLSSDSSMQLRENSFACLVSTSVCFIRRIASRLLDRLFFVLFDIPVARRHRGRNGGRYRSSVRSSNCRLAFHLLGRLVVHSFWREEIGEVLAGSATRRDKQEADPECFGGKPLDHR